MAVQEEFVFEITKVRRRIPLEDIIADLHKFANSQGQIDRTEQNYWNWVGRGFHPHTVVKYFGSWSLAMDAAGLDYDREVNRRIDPSYVEEELRRFARTFPATKRTMRSYEAWPSRKVPVGTVRAIYGNWHAAMTELGIECPGRSKSKKNSDDDLLIAVEKVWRWTAGKWGRSPSQMDFQRYTAEHADGVCYGTVIRRFGSMVRFLKAFAEWKKGKMPKGALLALTPDKRSRSPILPGIRYDLIRKAQGRCCECGHSVQDGTTLHIDHIVPVSKGGTNDKDNLRVLCQACNLGKSNRI